MFGIKWVYLPSTSRVGPGIAYKWNSYDGRVPSPYIVSSGFGPDLRLFFPSLFQASHLLSPVNTTVSVCWCVLGLGTEAGPCAC